VRFRLFDPGNMHVIATFGANLSHTLQGHYGLSVAPDRLVVDGVTKGDGAQTSFGEIDQWLVRYPGHLRVAGPSPAEWGSLFARSSRADADVIAIVSSSRLGSSYAEACAAAARSEDPSSQAARVAVVDTRATDVAAALLTLVAAEGMRARAPTALVLQTLELLARRMTFAWVAPSLRHLTMSGYRSTLQSSPTDASELKLILGLANGEVRVLGRVPTESDPAHELLNHAVKVAAKTTKLWVGVAHSGQPVGALHLEEQLRRRLPVEFAYRRTLAATSYVYLGPGALALALVPLDDLPWTPPPPPDFSETRRPTRRARSLIPE